jgi:hypothetical protein
VREASYVLQSVVPHMLGFLACTMPHTSSVCAVRHCARPSISFAPLASPCISESSGRASNANPRRLAFTHSSFPARWAAAPECRRRLGVLQGTNSRSVQGRGSLGRAHGACFSFCYSFSLCQYFVVTCLHIPLLKICCLPRARVEA